MVGDTLSGLVGPHHDHPAALVVPLLRCRAFVAAAVTTMERAAERAAERMGTMTAATSVGMCVARAAKVDAVTAVRSVAKAEVTGVMILMARPIGAVRAIAMGAAMRAVTAAAMAAAMAAVTHAMTRAAATNADR